MTGQPKTLAEFIDGVRDGLTCDRCGKYVGGIARERFRPPPYPVALDKIGAEDEGEALIGFEWYMLNLLRQGKFTIRHPQRDDRCVTFREWAAEEIADDEAAEA